MKRFLYPLLLIVLSGCSKPEPVVEVNPVEEKQEVKEEVQPEEPVAEAKPAEAVSVNPNLKYEIQGDAVTITGYEACTKRTEYAWTRCGDWSCSHCWGNFSGADGWGSSNSWNNIDVGSWLDGSCSSSTESGEHGS